ncbi:MAG TPA: cell division protein FtsZ, partial [Anaerolineaceae bacterium]|nr:cell division protein FtsZ [Anaerolineaceae bacterium]
DRLLSMVTKNVGIQDAFGLADDVLRQGIQGISELITVPGLINLDFADVKTIMRQGGAALMAVGQAKGEDRARIAAQQAISNQLLDVTINGAKGILFNVTGGPNMSLFEVNQAAQIIKETAHPDVNLIFGAVIDENMGDAIRITVIATGFDNESEQQAEAEKQVNILDAFSMLGSRQNNNREPYRTQGQQPVMRQAEKPAEEVMAVADVDDLAMPAFLRRQMNQRVSR